MSDNPMVRRLKDAEIEKLITEYQIKINYLHDRALELMIEQERRKREQTTAANLDKLVTTPVQDSDCDYIRVFDCKGYPITPRPEVH